MDLSGHCILVIVANACVLSMVSRLFAATGASVYGTDRGEEGLRQVCARRPDLIVMDLALPDQDQREVRDRIRDSARIPILFLSVLRAEYLERGDWGESGMAYVTMPFDPEVLLSRARAALQKGSLTSLRAGGLGGGVNCSPSVTVH